VVTRSDAVGGASIHVRDLARAVLDRGHRATVLVGGSGQVTELLRGAGIPFHSLRHLQRSLHPMEDARAYSELKSIFCQLRPDLVSTHTAKAGWLGRRAAHRLGIPVVHTPHGWPFSDRHSAAQGRAYTLAEKVAARWASAIVCVSVHEKELAVNKGITEASRLHVIYNGVPDVGPEMQARPGLEERVRFVSVARFAAPKDHETLLRAFARLGSFRHPPCELVLVGDGPGQSAARQLAFELGIAEWVRFTGYEPDPARTLAEANGFVLSSRSEAFPRSILEAMRAGLPVIASAVGGVMEMVSPGGSGIILVSPADVAALASALKSLKIDRLQRERMGVAARQTYEARYRLDRMTAETVDLYTTVLKAA
jgi:glycosyltransferase involved in cell wall biosynthesis